MPKIRVYELAKELGVKSNNIVEYLAENGVEVKSQSSIEEDMADDVREYFEDDENVILRKQIIKELRESIKETEDLIKDCDIEIRSYMLTSSTYDSNSLLGSRNKNKLANASRKVRDKKQALARENEWKKEMLSKYN